MQSSFLRDSCFGPEQWARYFGDVGTAPPLPPGIEQMLGAPCPIWEGRKVWETHRLLLVPRTLGGAPLTLNLIGSMVVAPREGHASSYLYFAPPARADIGDVAVDAAHWCLVTMDTIPGSKGMDYADQRQLVADLGRRADVPYGVPSTFQAALCILTHHVATGERLFAMNDAEKTWTFTRCGEEVSRDNWPVAIGGFQPQGLLLYRSPDFLFDRYFTGVAAVRRF